MPRPQAAEPERPAQVGRVSPQDEEQKGAQREEENERSSGRMPEGLMPPSVDTGGHLHPLWNPASRQGHWRDWRGSEAVG